MSRYRSLSYASLVTGLPEDQVLVLIDDGKLEAKDVGAAGVLISLDSLERFLRDAGAGDRPHEDPRIAMETRGAHP